MRWFLIFAGTLLAGFLAMILLLYFNQRKLLYYPQGLDKTRNQVKDHTRFAYEVNREGVTLRGWLLNPDSRRLIIYYGGNGEELSHKLVNFKPFEGFAVLLMNYRGYGESEGSPTEKDLVQDAVAILDEVKDRYDTIVLMGCSLGCGVAVQVASHRVEEVDRMVLITPYDSILAVAQGIYPWVPVSWLLKDRFDSLRFAKGLRIPALFLVAENDKVIPEDHARKLADVWSVPIEWKLIEGATHNTITEFPAYWHSLTVFLQENRSPVSN